MKECQSNQLAIKHGNVAEIYRQCHASIARWGYELTKFQIDRSQEMNIYLEHLSLVTL